MRYDTLSNDGIVELPEAGKFEVALTGTLRNGALPFVAGSPVSPQAPHAGGPGALAVPEGHRHRRDVRGPVRAAGGAGRGSRRRPSGAQAGLAGRAGRVEAAGPGRTTGCMSGRTGCTADCAARTRSAAAGPRGPGHECPRTGGRGRCHGIPVGTRPRLSAHPAPALPGVQDRQRAETRWRRLREYRQLAWVIEGMPFRDGIEVQSQQETVAAG